jgi:hypothetical protein
MTTTSAASPAPAGSTADVQALAAQTVAAMDTLIDLLRQETELVRQGRLGQAAKFAAAKAEAAQAYVADTLRLRASGASMGRLAPDSLAALKQRHEVFRGLLQINLTVLATAHAVSEGIVRGVSGERARKSSPQTYGASGRRNAPDPRAAQPLALSRLL